jgi:hypothetical protein
MAALFDAAAAFQTTNNNATPSWTHTPVGTLTGGGLRRQSAAGHDYVWCLTVATR